MVDVRGHSSFWKYEGLWESRSDKTSCVRGQGLTLTTMPSQPVSGVICDVPR